MSPTELTLRELRKRGYTAAVVEKWNPAIRVRHDLFGIVDVLALLDGETLAVQATSASHVSDRIKKITDSEHIAAIRKAGWRVVVWGWRKNKKSRRYVLREVDVS